MGRQLHIGIEVIEADQDNWQVLLVGSDARYHRVSASNKSLVYLEASDLARYWQLVLGCSVVFRPNAKKLMHGLAHHIAQCRGIA